MRYYRALRVCTRKGIIKGVRRGQPEEVLFKVRLKGLYCLRSNKSVLKALHMYIFFPGLVFQSQNNISRIAFPQLEFLLIFAPLASGNPLMCGSKGPCLGGLLWAGPYFIQNRDSKWEAITSHVINATEDILLMKRKMLVLIMKFMRCLHPVDWSELSSSTDALTHLKWEQKRAICLPLNTLREGKKGHLYLCIWLLIQSWIR